jgi:ABC-type transport system involved in cytochrome c biogenesis permease subunit
MIQENVFFSLAVALYILAAIQSLLYYKTLDSQHDWNSTQLLWSGIILHFLAIFFRWKLTGYVPVTTFYEMLTVLAFCLALVLGLARFRISLPILNVLFMPLILVFSIAALVTPHKELKPISPDLTTPLMAIHVLATLLGYSYFSLASAIGGTYWIQERKIKKHQVNFKNATFPALEILDQRTTYYVGLGLIFWTIGLAFGVFQAFKIWKDLPITDPKVVSAFLVWVIYASFFVIRWGFKVRGIKILVLVITGYLVALFTFLGVRLLMVSHHFF